MTPEALEITVSPRPGDRVKVSVIERCGAGRDFRAGTHEMTRRRWLDFYRPMYEARCAADSIRCVIDDRAAALPLRPRNPALPAPRSPHA